MLASLTEKEEESEKEAEEEDGVVWVWVSPRRLLRERRTGTKSATTIQRLMQLLRIFGACFCKTFGAEQEEEEEEEEARRRKCR